jgi:hypothetical protein
MIFQYNIARITTSEAVYGRAGRVGNFRQKNYSAEDGIDGTKGYFRRNSGYSAEQKIRSEPFRGRENNSEQNAATSVFDMTVFKLRVLVEAVRNGRDVAKCGLGWSRKWIFNYRVSRNCPLKGSQLRVITRNYA